MPVITYEIVGDIIYEVSTWEDGSFVKKIHGMVYHFRFVEDFDIEYLKWVDETYEVLSKELLPLTNGEVDYATIGERITYWRESA